MTKTNSVIGPIDSADLGYTLMHEHIMSAPVGTLQNNPEALGPGFMDRINKGLAEARDGGVSTIVDATTYDLGREVSVLADASRHSGVNIIACSGWWLSDPAEYYSGWKANRFADLFISEVREGIGGTGIKAGILKSAADETGVTKSVEITLRAIARAQVETGVPIMLHSCSPAQAGRQQIEVLKEEGVNLTRVTIDHSLDTTNTGYLIWLMEQGCWLGLDRLPGLEISVGEQLKTAKALIDAGWAHRLLFSHDQGLAVYMPQMPPEVRELIERATPQNKFLYLKNVFFPMLHGMGVPSTLLEQICIDNPRNFFDGK